MDPSTVNVSGSVVQAGVIHGGVHFHRGGRPRTVPRQLPMAVRHFAGRHTELDLLTEIGHQATTEPAVTVVAISGTGGIGKTTLAVRWAHSVAERYPDGQLCLNLRGFDPTAEPVDPDAALRGFLDALAVGPRRIPDTLDGKIARYRSLLAERRMLVVLDNARDADQIRPLLPGSPGCLVLVTSRSKLTDLIAQEGARPVALDVFTDQEAGDLLTHHLGQDRIAAEPDTVADLIEFCVRLPLALSIVAAQAAAHPHFKLADLLGQLREERRLDALGGVRAVFSWSYRTLSAEAARMFRLLGLHLGPDIGLRTAASLAGVPLPGARAALTELTGANLVDQDVPGRYRLHDLVRAYAGELVEQESEEDRLTAQRRMLDFLLHTTLSAAVILNPNRDPQHPDPIVADTAFVPVTDTEGAFRWYQAELATLTAAVRFAAASEFVRYAWEIPWCMTSFLYRRGRWQQWASIHETALAVAADHARARTHRLLGNAYTLLGRQADGRAEHESAQALFAARGDDHGLGRTHHARAWADERFGEHRSAIEHAERALELYRGYGNRSGEAHALDAAGWFHARLGEFEPALARCTEALALHTELDDLSGVADDHDSLGYIHHHLGDVERSFVEYRKAVELWRELGAAYDEAVTLIRYGEAQVAGGDQGAGLGTWRQALEILVQLDHPDADPLRTRIAAAEQ